MSISNLFKNAYYLGLTGTSGSVQISTLTPVSSTGCTGGQIITDSGCISPPFVCGTMNSNIPALGPTGPNGSTQAQFNLSQTEATPIANAGTNVQLICAYDKDVVKTNFTPATVATFFTNYGDVNKPWLNKNYTQNTQATFNDIMFQYCFEKSSPNNQTTCPTGTSCPNVIADPTNCDKSSNWYKSLNETQKLEYDVILGKACLGIKTGACQPKNNETGWIIIVAGIILALLLIGLILWLIFRPKKSKTGISVTTAGSTTTIASSTM